MAAMKSAIPSASRKSMISFLPTHAYAKRCKIYRVQKRDPSNSRGACGSNDTQTIFSRLDFRILLYKLLYITLDLIALSIPTWRKRRRMMLRH